MIKAEIIADSLNEWGQRLTTFVLVFPRIVLAEFNTHRMLSRNSASSRAIPFAKMVKMVKENPFVPIRWMKEHTGMQGSEYFNPTEMVEKYMIGAENIYGRPNYQTLLSYEWLVARDNAVKQAKRLDDIGVTKQFVNRLLEPFMWHTVIVTGSEWENFFALRAHPAAEIHIADLADKMLKAYNESNPQQLTAGEWHIPFGDKLDEVRIRKVFKAGEGPMNIQEAKIQIATARCARVSYLNFEGKDDYEADIKLHDTLKSMGHMSPFEHCAKAMSSDEYDTHLSGGIDIIGEFTEVPESTKGWSGNFRGFIQYRKMLVGENKTDNRVIKK